MLPPRVAKYAPLKAVANVPSARYSFFIARPNITLFSKPKIVVGRTQPSWRDCELPMKIGLTHQLPMKIRDILEVNAFLAKMKNNKQERIRTRTWWQQRVGGRALEFRDVESCYPEVPALKGRAVAAAKVLEKLHWLTCVVLGIAQEL